PLEKLSSGDHRAEILLGAEEVVAAVEFPGAGRTGGHRNGKANIAPTLGQAAGQCGFPRPGGRRKDDREGHGCGPSGLHHSTFSTCSRKRSTSSLIATTRCAISALFALDPIVFASRCISCTRKESRFPTDSSAGAASRSANS